MCLAADEPGGPRRCSSDARCTLERSTAAVCILTDRSAELRRAVTGGAVNVPEPVADAVAVAAVAGTPFIVGGAVRDSLLGGNPHDFDVEVHGTDLGGLARRFTAAGWEVDEVGRQFGVLKVRRPGEEAVDVAVPRRDNKIGAGHRGFSVDTGGAMSVAEAAARRDFTVNAIYFDPEAGMVVDPFGGVADLEARVLRHVSDAFGEDPLRVLRGVQFAGRFAMTVHPTTAALCRGLRPHFGELAAERVQLEWGKIYTSGHPEMAAAALCDTGWDDTLPGLKSALSSPAVMAGLRRLPSAPAADRVALGAALITHTMSVDDRRVFLAATVVGKDAAVAAQDLAGIDPSALSSSAARKQWAHQGAKRGFTFGRYLHYAQILDDPQAVEVARAGVADGLGAGPEPAWVQGRDVMAAAAGRRAGPWVGQLVEQVLQMQHRGEFSGRDEALTWLNDAVRAVSAKR